MNYLEDIFIENISKEKISTIFELGSRDLLDAKELSSYYNSRVYAFECNPECISECKKNYAQFTPTEKEKVRLIEKAVSSENGYVEFYAIDMEKYNNIGASSLLPLDFSKLPEDNIDYKRENPQKKIKVEGVRLDTFIKQEKINKVDLLCMDLQGYELEALKSLGEELVKIKYIILECALKSTYVNGCNFQEINFYLNSLGFEYTCSGLFGYQYPCINDTHHLEFNTLYVNTEI